MAVRVQDGVGNPLTSTSNALDVNIKSSGVSQPITGTISVSNFPTTQPVSIALPVAVTGTFFPATQPVSIASAVAVTGTFFQATQPVSIASAVAVTGTFFQTTQPVSGTVAINNFPATTTVAGSVSVSNFPASQTVSGTVLVSNMPGAGTNGAAVPGSTILLGGRDGTGILRSLLTDATGVLQVALPSFPAILTVQGTVTISDGTNNADFVAKGVQGSTALTVQSLIDSGRTNVCVTLDAVPGVTAEALTTMTINKGGAVSTATTYTVTAGKILRIQSLYLSVRASAATLVNARVRLRSATTVNATSPIFANIESSSNAAVIGAANPANIAAAEGIEFAGGQQIGLSQIASATSALLTLTLIGFEY